LHPFEIEAPWFCATKIDLENTGVKRRPLRVLVVDDSEVVRRVICRLLRAYAEVGVVCEASDGMDAVHFSMKYKPDLILMDIAMPVMNGFDAMRLIKDALPETQILVVSQHDISFFKKEAIAAGANGYVSKTEASTQLIPEVRRITSRELKAS
jgi:DNA-binding NarL/FixJ family response regulator